MELEKVRRVKKKKSAGNQITGLQVSCSVSSFQMSTVSFLTFLS
jgi:hypothetical protein